MTDEDYDKIVRHINKALTLGWNPTSNAWASLGNALLQQEARDQPIWGIRESYLQRDTQNGGTKTSMQVALVANAWAFHPLATPIRDVTYDEAIALHKLKN